MYTGLGKNEHISFDSRRLSSAEISDDLNSSSSLTNLTKMDDNVNLRLTSTLSDEEQGELLL